MRRICFVVWLAIAWLVAAAVQGAAPSIVRQPANQSTTVGQPVVFKVEATGTPPLQFQWYRDGSEVSGATGADYVLTAQLVDNGVQFHAVVINSYGAATSSVATLIVTADSVPPTVGAASNAPNYVQVVVRFSERMAVAQATDSSHYGIDAGYSITGATLDPSGSNVVLSVTPALTEGTTYTVTVANLLDLAGNVLSSGQASFRAAVMPFITAQPESRVVNPGANVSFSVNATGTDPKTLQWYRNSTPLAGQTGTTLTISSVQIGDIGGYRVVIANSLGAVTSAVATLSFSGSYTVFLPAGYSFVAKQLQNSNPRFPTPLDGTTVWRWQASNQTFQAHTYSTASGWSPEEPDVAVGEGVVIYSPQAWPLTFTGTRVVPQLPVSLQPGLNLLGAQVPTKAAHLGIVGPPVQGSLIYRFKGGDPTTLNESSYRIHYYRDDMWFDGPAPIFSVGESAFFSQVTPVAITAHPAPITNATLGQSAFLSVTATGSPPIRYQWRLNGQNIFGATNSTYSLTSLAASNAGLYSVSVGNIAGAVISSNVVLAPNIPALALSDDFGSQPVVDELSRLVRSSNRGATIQPGELPHGGKRTGSSVWFTWIAESNGIMTISAAGSGFDTVLAAYVGSTISTLTLIDASDDDSGWGCSRLRFNARAGVAYKICVAGLGDSQGDIVLGWNLEPTAQSVPELGVQPQDITVALGGVAQFNVTATNNGPFTFQWFRNGVAIPSAFGSTLTLSNVTDLDVGNYFVRVANQGRFRDSRVASLQIESADEGLPLTGARATPKLLDVGLATTGQLTAPRPKFGTVNRGYSGSQTVSSVGAGKDIDEPNHCNVTGGNSIWYVVQATNNGTMYMNTDGSSFDTVLAVYTGPSVITSYSQLTNVACDNDSGLDGIDSRVSFTAASNTIYYAAVDGVSGASGTVKIAYRLVLPLTLTNLIYTNISGGRFTMKVNGTPSLAAQVQFSTNLSTWTTLTNYTAPSGTFQFTNNNVGPISNRVYRALNNF